VNNLGTCASCGSDEGERCPDCGNVETCCGPCGCGSTAYTQGVADGLAWDLGGFQTTADVERATIGWDEATINAIGSSECRKAWGLHDVEAGDDVWGRACADYNRGAHKGATAAQKHRTGLPPRSANRRYELCEGGHWYETVDAASASDALAIARENVDRGNYPEAEGTLYIDIRARRVDDHDDEETDTVVLPPEEPECSHDDGHDWQSPYRLVGGLKENPGVFGHGGGVIMHSVCMRCGCERVTDTWAQRRDTGEQGLTEVSYEPGKYAAEVATVDGDAS
jgi:hypothetical protein